MKIICFGHTIDPAFIAKQYAHELVVLLPTYAKHLSKNFKHSQIIFFDFPKNNIIEDFSDNELLNRSDIIKKIRKSKGTHFLVSHRSSKELFARCLKLNLTPIGNNPAIAFKLENKLYFDKLMSDLKIPKPALARVGLNKLSKNDLPVVIQDANSFGSFGTTIVSNIEQLTRIKKTLKTKASSLLIRKFINGNVYGISMVIHPDGLVLSSIRQQCYFDTSNSKSAMTFAGIQWIAKSKLHPKIVKSIEESCVKIGNFLTKKNFNGVIHFDFMVDRRQQVFFLECNPRPSSATPQLLKHPELVHKLDFSPILLQRFNNLPNKPYIPNSKFKGSLLDLMILDKATITIHDQASKQIKSIKYFFSINSLSSSRKLSFLGTIISDEPLFTNSGTLNVRAKKLYKKYSSISI